MSSGDQDKQFDELLGRHVRRSVRDDVPDGCPAADVLAAYHDCSLSPEEMSFWKQHIAACNSCQEILAQLEATGEIAAPEELFDFVQQEVVVAQAAPLAADPRPEMAEEMAAATAATVARAGSPISISSRSPLPTKAAAPRKYVRWIAPAGAIAAGLLLWVAVREARAPKLSPYVPVEIAENRRNSAAPLAQPQVRGDLRSGDSLSKKDSASGTAPVRKQRPRNEAEFSAFSGALPAKPAQAPSKLSEEPKKERETLDAVGAASAELDSNSVPLASAKSVPLPAAPPPALPAPGAAPGERSAAAAGAIADKKKSEIDSTTAAAAKSRNFELRDSPVLRKAFAHNAPLVVAADGAAVWRLGAAGAIAFSADKGATWKPQQSFVTADLIAGSATSAKICWVVGTHGTILLTTDGGETWTKISSPLAENLSGIYASDRLHARVWAAFTRDSFETSDGGATWKQVANQ
ncbi:MAG TPA: hypothetical protein VK525_16580 [Candidatus Saccharimonadales bacterium]|nr:hypothetical protein [Candidatus Saccharimonadales bacterium]